MEHLGGGLDGRLNGGVNLGAEVVVGELSHALKHVCRRVGLHQLEDGGATQLVGLTGVLVDVEEHLAGGNGVDADKLVQRDDHKETLEVRHGDLAFEVGLKDGEDLGVSKVAEGADVDLDLVAVSLPNGILQLLGHVGQVLVGEGGQVGGGQTTEGVHGVTVVSGDIVDLSLAGEVSEGLDGGDVQETLISNQLVGGQFLQHTKQVKAH